MKQKNLAMLGVAVGCGLVAAVAVAKLSAGSSKGPDTIKVLVAKKDIPLQTKLDEKELDNLLAWADVPKNIVPPDAVTDLEQVKGKSLNRTLKQGNPVSFSDLGDHKRLELPEGFDGMSVKVDQVGAVAGFAKPGSRVDVMYVERTNSGKVRAAIILKYMLVVAVNTINVLDEKTGAAIPQVESVTLAVNKEQAKRLTFAAEKGKVSLLLTGAKNEEEAKKFNEDPINFVDDPFDTTRPPPVVSAPTTQKGETAVVTKKPVPLNTLINADNVNEYFTTVEVRVAPSGVVKSPDDLKGLYVVKALDEGQYLYKSLTDSKAVEVARMANPTLPVAPPKVEHRFPRYEQVIVEGGRIVRVIWMEIAPNKWKRFDSLREADEYKPEPAAPKPDESKPEPKAGSGQ
jgi:Flp pilus assembly protein CpaB